RPCSGPSGPRALLQEFTRIPYDTPQEGAMDAARLLAFLGVAVVLTVSPGPDFALVTRTVFARGRLAGWWTSLGVVTGHLSWGIAAGAGVAALLNASATLYSIIRLAGAAYLVWLGLQAIFSRGHSAAPSGPPDARASGRVSRWRAYRQGLI